jgi:hypothetical protein
MVWFAWIGIDGTQHVTQIGTVQYVSSDGHGNISKSCYAVYEWWPNNWTAINNFPVNFGDTAIGLICLESTTDASANPVNATTSLHVSFDFSAPTSTSSLEKSDRVSNGRPRRDRRVCPAAKLRRDLLRLGHGWPWSRALAYAGTDTVIDMAESNVKVATTTVETSTLIKIAYTGS